MKHDPCPDPQSLSLCMQHSHLSSNIRATHASLSSPVIVKDGDVKEKHLLLIAISCGHYSSVKVVWNVD
jgi:hypothetical protein